MPEVVEAKPTEVHHKLRAEPVEASTILLAQAVLEHSGIKKITQPATTTEVVAEVVATTEE